MPVSAQSDNLLSVLKSKLTSKILRFVLIGGTGTTIYIILTLVLNAKIGLPAALASFVAHCCTALYSYLGHRVFTFGSNRPHRQAITRFTGLTLVGYGFSITIPWLMTSVYGLPLIIPVLVTSVAVPLLNFLMMERIVFPKNTQKEI